MNNHPFLINKLMIIKNNNPYLEPSHSLKNRIARSIWSLVYYLFFRTSPIFLHFWRVNLLKLFGAEIGKNCHIYPTVKVWAPWNLKVGNFVGIGGNVNLYNIANITIQDYSVISQGCHLCTGSHDYNSSNLQLISSPIELGSHVWMCSECFVCPGVLISDGSVIGARSVVTKNIPIPWCVWAGIPPNKISARNKNEVLKIRGL